MALFIIGLVSFVLTFIITLLILGLWVYEDAKVKSNQQPGLWVLIVLIVPNLIGLIIYLLVGRTNKSSPSPGTYKKPLIAAAVCFLIAIGLFIGGLIHFTSADRFDAQHIGSFVGIHDNANSRGWTVSADIANGTSQRNFSLSASELAAFYAISSANGEVWLSFRQGERAKSVDISGIFSGPIDLSGFDAGRLEITMEFVNAENVNTAISWR